MAPTSSLRRKRQSLMRNFKGRVLRRQRVWRRPAVARCRSCSTYVMKMPWKWPWIRPRAFWRHRHLREQRIRNQFVQNRGDRGQALRSHPVNQYARNLPRLAGMCAASAKERKCPRANPISTAVDARGLVAQHLPYTLSKYGMSMVTFRMAEEFRPDGIAFNALWPRTTIATVAIEHALGGIAMIRMSRRPEIMRMQPTQFSARCSVIHRKVFA